MIRLSFYIAVIIFVIAKDVSSNDPKILGGFEVDIEDYPFQLSLEVFGKHRWGAVVIHPEWALTAAGCIKGKELSDIRLRSGVNRLSSNEGVIHPAIQLITHDLFGTNAMDYDVGLVRVAVRFTSPPVPLASATPPYGTPGTIIGWGKTNTSSDVYSDVLMAGVVIVVDHATCNKVLENMGGVTIRMLCAGTPEVDCDWLDGDGGGPLISEEELVGIMSWGLSHGLGLIPSVYTDVAFFRSWIRLHTGV